MLRIDDIITSLESIISECDASGSRLGYFAALYLKVTKSVKQGIEAGQFADGARMEKLDVLFAGRYPDAYHQWKNGQQTTASWRIAFEQAARSQVLVLQHLLLGMNAHINLDLGIAAVEVCEGQPLNPLKPDFDMINSVISALTYQVLNELDHISPLLSLLGLHAGNEDSILIQFSIDNARDGAWCFAEDLAQKQADAYQACIMQRDATIAKLGASLVKTKGFMRFTVWVIHLFEWKNVRKIIRELNEYQKKKLQVNSSV
ncbi:MAG TPA: DUF5995 family protein [Mucilaginibacter sp.]|nr:DUF5995 family protein [Mucilaginibacter sp.]